MFCGVTRVSDRIIELGSDSLLTHVRGGLSRNKHGSEISPRKILRRGLLSFKFYRSAELPSRQFEPREARLTLHSFGARRRPSVQIVKFLYLSACRLILPLVMRCNLRILRCKNLFDYFYYTSATSAIRRLLGVRILCGNLQPSGVMYAIHISYRVPDLYSFSGLQGNSRHIARIDYQRHKIPP